MEHIISIPITPPDQDALVPQVGFALEQLRELASRRKHPKLWALSDRLCPLPQDSYGVIQKRRKRRRALGLMNWMLGAFGTLIVLMPPEMPFSVTAAASICLGVGSRFCGGTGGLCWVCSACSRRPFSAFSVWAAPRSCGT